MESDPAHDCLEHLAYRQAEWIERHGLDCGPFEHCREQWWECSVCGEKFTGEELDKIGDSI